MKDRIEKYSFRVNRSLRASVIKDAIENVADDLKVWSVTPEGRQCTVKTVTVEGFTDDYSLECMRTSALIPSLRKNKEDSSANYYIPVTITAVIPRNREKLLKESDVREAMNECFVAWPKDKVIDQLFGNE